MMGFLTVKTRVGGTLLILVFSAVCFGQDLVTNKSVIEMVKIGLSAEVVIAKIRASVVSFDTSTNALKELSDAGVPEIVVVEMINQAGKATRDASKTERENSKLLNSVPEQGKLSDLLSVRTAFVSTDDLKARDIIIRELKKIKKFEVVDAIENADFIVQYDSWTELVNVSATVIGNTATARENHQLVGLFTIKMMVEKNEAGRLRLVYSARKSKYFVWEDNPAESTTKQFIKDLTKAAAALGYSK